MAIASRFQPRNLAESRFNPFYGEMGGAPAGPGIRRAAATVSGGSPISAESDSSIPPPGIQIPPPEEDIPLGETFSFRKGLLPTSTPTFNVHNPYYGPDQERERWYSGSYGWRLPGGSGLSGGTSGSYDPYNPWGGEDRKYTIGNPYSDEPAFGTNITPYDERWFSGSSLVPKSYESYIEDITTTPSSDPDIMSTTTGMIPSWVGMMKPETSSDYYEYQPPKEMTLWGKPHTALSRVSKLADPRFVHSSYG